MDIQKIALALQGFSSGVQGTLPQFMAQQDQKALIDQQQKQQRNKELSVERKHAMAQDMREIGEKLRAGLKDLAITQLNNREKVGMLLPDFDAVTTQEIRSLISSGNEQEALKYLDIIDNAAVDEGILPKREQPQLVAVSENERLVNPDTGATVIESVSEPAIQVPPALLAGVPSDLIPQATAAFETAGGGSVGIGALNDVVARGKNASVREKVPSMLKASYPQASEAEMAQLRAAVDGANDVETGLKIASDIRAEQRRLLKAKGFQERAVDLLGRILSSDELDDITGPIEGSSAWGLGILHAFDQQETDLIADIEEAQNILTAENLDLMSGVLSESDIQLLKSLASGALDRRRSEPQFRKDVEELLAKLSSVQVQTVDDIAQEDNRAGLMANVGQDLQQIANLPADQFEQVDLSALSTEQLQALENHLMGTAKR